VYGAAPPAASPSDAPITRLTALPTRFLIVLLSGVVVFAVVVGLETAAGLNCLNARADSNLAACLPAMFDAGVSATSLMVGFGYLLIVGVVLAWPRDLGFPRQGRIPGDEQPPRAG
jgi:hypothetical protein